MPMCKNIAFGNKGAGSGDYEPCECFNNRADWLHTPIPIGTTVYQICRGEKLIPVEINGEQYMKKQSNGYITQCKYDWIMAICDNEKPMRTEKYYFSLEDARAALKGEETIKEDI